MMVPSMKQPSKSECRNNYKRQDEDHRQGKEPFYLARSLIRNFEAKDCLEPRSRFVNSNSCEKLQMNTPLSTGQSKHQITRNKIIQRMFTASKNVSLLTYTNAIRKFHILKRPWAS
jgi:hypothetical protein